MIEELAGELPPATLLLGPDLGKMLQAACIAARDHGVAPVDGIVRRHVSAADARNIVQFAQTAPFGPFKLVIVCLDGSTPVAQNILLKVLEEPPGSIRFILVARERPLPTIVSRCQVVTVAGGQESEPDAQVIRQVSTALKAAAAGDLHALDAALKGWGDAQHAVLSLLLAEAAVRGSADIGLLPGQARRLLGALGRFAGASPRIAAHAALVFVLSDRESHA